VEAEGRRCLLFSGDLQEEAFCRQAVRRTINELGRLDIVVNNAGMQFPKDDVDHISSEQLQATFRTNIFAYFYVVQEAVHYLPEGGVIINTGSVTAYRGSAHLIDYSSTKGAIASFTRSLAGSLAKKKVRVNGVAPGPIWTPLIVSTFDDVTDFGQDTPMGRAGQPSEVGPAYVFLASEDSSYVTGQLLHVNGGDYFGQ
jgi:NAD(P)-dependent dehydrogenase (short-subunit alcohol dehydrogenase family)